MDTGAMYRAVALIALDRSVPLDDATRIAMLADSLAIAFRDGRVFVGDRDVSTEIRTARVTSATRPVADAPPVREVMKQMQRRIAAGIDVVTEGRDQGSEVFPDAEVKVFLTASPVERALRRHREETARGVPLSLDDVLDAQNRRDEGDRMRPVGAMQPAADAVLVETDGLTQEEVVDRLVRLIEARRRPRHA
jgi:cytidylate kinase